MTAPIPPSGERLPLFLCALAMCVTITMLTESSIGQRAMHAWIDFLYASYRNPVATETVAVLLDAGHGSPGVTQSDTVDKAFELIAQAGPRAVLVTSSLSRSDIDRRTRLTTPTSFALSGRVIYLSGALGLPSEQLVGASTRPSDSDGLLRFADHSAVIGVRSLLLDPNRPESAALLGLIRLSHGAAVPASWSCVHLSVVFGHSCSVQGVLTPYSTKAGSNPVVRVSQVETLGKALKQLTGKVVVLGLDDQRLLGVTMPEIYAGQAEALLKGRTITLVNTHVAIIVALGVAVLAYLLFATLALRYSLVIAAGLSALSVVASWLLFQVALVLFPHLLLFPIGLMLAYVVWLNWCLHVVNKKVIVPLVGQTDRDAAVPSDLSSFLPKHRSATLAETVALAADRLRSERRRRTALIGMFDRLPVAVVVHSVERQTAQLNHMAQLLLGSPGLRTVPWDEVIQKLQMLKFESAQDYADVVRGEGVVRALAADGDALLIRMVRLPVTRARQMPRLLVFDDVGSSPASAHDRARALDFLSHDLRSPLSSAIAITREMLREQLPSYTKSRVSRMQQLVQRSLDLAQNFVQLARSEELDTAGFKEFSLGELVEDVIADVFPQAQRKQVEIDAPEWTAVRVRGDQALVYRALVNLLTNAIEVTQANGLVSIEIISTASYVEVVIRDSGPGFPESVLESYVSGEAKRSPTRGYGSGLGLMLAATVARKHGGYLSMRNSEKGAQATLLLPEVKSDSATALEDLLDLIP